MNDITFPKEYLRPTDKVVCLFSAAFGGVHDVKYVHEAGVKDCIMVDWDEEKLAAMKYDYTKVKADCFSFIDECVDNGALFDVVISDQWTQQIKIINTDYLERLKKITKRVLIVGCSQLYLNDNEVKEPLMWRSTHLGGIFWRIIVK